MQQMIYDKEFMAGQLALYRARKGISAREMSLSLGQSANYMNKIESKKAYPSMEMFFQICEFLEVTPVRFFDVDSNISPVLNELINELAVLDDTALVHLLEFVRHMDKK